MVNVIGLGYIGLPTALMLAAAGERVVGTDCKSGVVESLKKGELTFCEAGMQELFDTASENIAFSDTPVKAQFYIIAVATPYDNESKKIDASHVCKALRDVLSVCERGSHIIIESTLSPGTTDNLLRPIVRTAGFVPEKDIFLSYAPERIIPGNMIAELKENSRTVGADSTETAERVRDLYSTFCEGEIILCDIKSAEMTKVVENTYRAVNIAFANELAKICRYDGMDVYKIIEICNKHPRVNILSPGPGVGGHCISVDPWFLVGDYPKLTNLISEALTVNAEMPSYVHARLCEIMKKHGIDDFGKVGLYGLSYKENVDDYRESPTLQLIDFQKENGIAPLKVYDPYIKEKICDNQHFSLDSFLDGLSLVVVLVGHNEIVENMHKLSDKIVFDTRNVCGKNAEKL